MSGQLTSERVQRATYLRQFFQNTNCSTKYEGVLSAPRFKAIPTIVTIALSDYNCDVERKVF